VIASGFVLGVVIDRMGDSLLDRREKRGRLRVAWNPTVRRQRERLTGKGVIDDPFPEDWLRIAALSDGGEGVVRWIDQLRIRIRIARSLTVLAPALATSGVAALRASASPTDLLVACPAVSFLFLLGVFLVLRFSPTLRGLPSTREEMSFAPGGHAADSPEIASAIEHEIDTKFSKSWWLDPLTVWCSLHFALAVVLLGSGVNDLAFPRVEAAGVSVLGAVITALALSAWERISVTYRTFLWETGIYRDSEKLRRVIAGEVLGEDRRASSEPSREDR
jgi:hypothetical protein